MKKIIFKSQTNKLSIVSEVESYIKSLDLTVVDKDTSKPWGAYFVIDEAEIDHFIQLFFADITVERSGKLTPKILVVAPHEILSWQYHLRRAELWRIITGPIEIVQSHNDSQKPPVRKNAGDLVTHSALTRHRLIGAGVWGVVAEIWQHTVPTLPSNEDDIVRLTDAYGR